MNVLRLGSGPKQAGHIPQAVLLRLARKHAILLAGLALPGERLVEIRARTHINEAIRPVYP